MKLKIDNDALADEFLEDAVLLGIVAPMKDYQFCWNLNQLLGFDFKINNDYEIQLNKKKRNYFFSVYEYKSPLNSFVHILYNNQYDGEHLLPEFKHLDFIWLIRGDILEKEELNALIKSVKTVPGVQLAAPISPDQIKNKLHLII